jgi:hypothetical protein
MQKMIIEIREIIKKKIYEKNIRDGNVDISDPLDILVQDKVRDENVKDKHSLDVFF